MNIDSAIEQAAALLREAHASGAPCPPVRNLLPTDDLSAAYRVQTMNTERWKKAGRRVVGCKIGLTSPAVQRQLGVDQPDYGMLFADMNCLDGETISISRVLQPKAEAEVVCVLGRDLVGEQLTLPEIVSAIDYLLPGIEIVGSRIANWDIKIVDTIADNASSGLYVLGSRPVSLGAVDLRLCGMSFEKNGDVTSTGVGAACLGHPLHALLWLARQMVSVGAPLRAGDVVLTGALGPMTAVVAGDWIEARIAGLGSVRARFSA
ncbi:MAG: fumarylacetoacetate hydrolase family protein [Steroidobacteraceae bacterium]|nr:fumarylacetoacetate hydrolase family protein [Steroidobacteraceae bacterium]